MFLPQACTVDQVFMYLSMFITALSVVGSALLQVYRVFNSHFEVVNTGQGIYIYLVIHSTAWKMSTHHFQSRICFLTWH